MKLILEINEEIVNEIEVLHYEVFALKDLLKELITSGISQDNIINDRYITAYKKYEKAKKEIIETQVIEYAEKEIGKDIDINLLSWSLDFEKAVVNITYNEPQNICSCGCC